MKFVVRVLLLALMSAVLLGRAPVAQAQRAAPDKETQRLFEEGNAFLQARNYGDALARYRAAYDRYPNARILLNMGTALHGLGRNVEALDAYEKFARDPEADPAHRQEAATTMKRLEAQVARLDIEVSEPGAGVTVDGHAFEKVPGGLWLEPGRHTVVASKDGFQNAEETMSLEAAQTKKVRLALTAIIREVPPPPPLPPPPPAAPATRDIGIELGVRAGYGVPFGSVDGGDTGALSHYTSGAFPLVVDADVRLPGHFLVGVLFQYASLRDPADCGNNCFPSSSATRLGVTLGYRRELGTRLRAQAGLGVGYEWLAVNGSEELRWSGLELGRLETGADYLVAPRVALGPFVSFSLSRYTNGPLDVMGNANPPALHSWLLFGVRAGFSVWP